MTSVCADLMQRDRVLDRGDGGDLIYPCSGCFCCFPQLFGPLLLLLFVVWAAFVLRFASDMVSENAAYRERC